MRLLILLLLNGCGETETIDLEGQQKPQEPSCEELTDETACTERNCAWETCYGCDGSPISSVCAGPGFVPPCPPLNCPPPCDSLDHDACVAAGDCHAVYVYGDTCCDAPGCCMRFDRCAAGANATCSGVNLACLRAAPNCEFPYVISYEGNCYEGCAEPSECAP